MEVNSPVWSYILFLQYKKHIVIFLQEPAWHKDSRGGETASSALSSHVTLINEFLKKGAERWIFFFFFNVWTKPR